MGMGNEYHGIGRFYIMRDWRRNGCGWQRAFISILFFAWEYHK
jgi:hypothetical protein